MACQVDCETRNKLDFGILHTETEEFERPQKHYLGMAEYSSHEGDFAILKLSGGVRECVDDAEAKRNRFDSMKMEVSRIPSSAERVVVDVEGMKASMTCDYFEVFHCWAFARWISKGSDKISGGKLPLVKLWGHQATFEVEYAPWSPILPYCFLGMLLDSGHLDMPRIAKIPAGFGIPLLVATLSCIIDCHLESWHRDVPIQHTCPCRNIFWPQKTLPQCWVNISVIIRHRKG
jgi:hypothetical protein